MRLKNWPFVRALKQSSMEFINATQIHGLRYVIQPRTAIAKRLFWFVMLTTSVLGACSLVNVVWLRYLSNPVRSFIDESNTPMGTMEFPAVTFCQSNILFHSHITKFINKVSLYDNITREEVRHGIEKAILFFTEGSLNYTEMEVIQDILDYNRYSVIGLMNELTQSCKDLLFKCRWERKYINCLKVFTVVWSTNGYCCSFNINIDSMVHNRLYTPYYGTKNGLSVVLNPIRNPEHFSTAPYHGVKAIVHESFAYPSKNTRKTRLHAGQEIFVSVTATRNDCDEEVRKLAVEDRECVFPDEKSLEYFSKYRGSNCEEECFIKRSLEYCECVPFFYPSNKDPICNFTKIDCLSKHHNVIYAVHSKDMEVDGEVVRPSPCYCPERCSDISYTSRTSESTLEDFSYNSDSFYNSVNSSHIVVHVYFGKQSYVSWRLSLLSSWINLVASLGGIFSLFMGCSFLSAIEILYYFTIHLCIVYNDIQKRDAKKVDVQQLRIKRNKL